MTGGFWTNPSVVPLAEEGDPVAVIVERARRLVVEAAEAGWTGPPFDPIRLADHLGVAVVPTDDVYDARLVPTAEGVRIEFNPNRPAGRRRFSVAHEIGHLLFEDHGEAVRNRVHADRASGDDWQLEMLCNLAAAEMLMPASSLEGLDEQPLALAPLLELRRQLEVSAESLLLRAVRFTGQPRGVFAASRTDPSAEGSSYRIDYVVGSRQWRPAIRQGALLAETALAECTAVGYTTSARESWPPTGEELAIQAVGIPAYPGHRYPRVVGLVAPAENPPGSIEPAIRYVVGDATEPRGAGARLVAHVVNNRAVRFHGGFSAALRERWPAVERDFTGWASGRPSPLRLGAVHVTRVDEGLSVVHMVAQSGYGPSSTPRIRYGALRQSLEHLAALALDRGASVHLPRIGAGQGGGNWFVIEELILAEVAGRGVGVTVYDLPGARPAPSPEQAILALH